MGRGGIVRIIDGGRGFGDGRNSGLLVPGWRLAQVLMSLVEPVETGQNRNRSETLRDVIEMQYCSTMESPTTDSYGYDDKVAVEERDEGERDGDRR